MTDEVEGSFGEAFLERGCIVIRVRVRDLPVVVRGGCEMGLIEPPMRVTDADEFAEEVVRTLNDEGELGTTAVHRLFDRAFEKAYGDGAEGVEEISEEEWERHLAGKDWD